MVRSIFRPALVCLSAFAVNFVAAQQSRVPPLPVAATPATSSLSDCKHLYDTGQFAQAEADYRALTSGPNAALAYVGLTELYLQEKKPTDAYAAAAKAMKLAPNSQEVKIAEGEVDFRQGKFVDSETQFIAAVNGGTKNARAFLGLAKILDAAFYYHHAKLLIDRAHALDPTDPDVTRAWIGTLPQADHIAALRAYLSGRTDDDAEDRTRLRENLSYLEQRQTDPNADCHIVSNSTSTETPLREMLNDDGHPAGYGLKVDLNGSTANLLLDTGSAGILVSSKFAKKAKLAPSVASQLRGIGDRGPAPGYVAFADSIQVGGIEFKGCPVEVIDKGSVADQDGLIGADVFSRFLVEFDFPAFKLRLSPLPPRPGEPAAPLTLDASDGHNPQFHDRYVAPEMKDYTLIFHVSDLLLIPTVLDDKVSTLFAIDTGAAQNFISPAAAREVTNILPDSSVRVAGINGEVKNVYSTNQLTLSFADFRQKNVGMISFDTKPISDSVGTEVSGLLGFTVLRLLDLKIDYRDGLVWFGDHAKRRGN